MEKNSNTKKVKIFVIGAPGKMGKALCALAEKDPTLQLTKEHDMDVVIDFSSPEGTKKAISFGKPLVCGTTALPTALFDALYRLSETTPVLYSPNFSLGIALCFEILETFAKKLNDFSHISIEETHRIDKKDTPSGTALKMAHILGISQITSHRIEGAIGEHSLHFSTEAEQLKISHQAFSRDAFAKGALTAAKFIFNKPAKLYTLKDLFY